MIKFLLRSMGACAVAFCQQGCTTGNGACKVLATSFVVVVVMVMLIIFLIGKAGK